MRATSFIDDSVTFYDLALCEEMIKAAESVGWKYPAPIQREAIPKALEGLDICGMAETGSGKTGAFALPLLHQLLDKRTPLFGLILEPTRELVLQVANVFRELGKEIGLKVCAITGGVEEKAQIASLEKKPHVVVATTGRLNQILRERPQINMKSVKVLVFDEADRMLSDSFLDEVKNVLGRIGNDHQTMLFSATMPEEIETLMKMSLNNPFMIELARNQVAITLTEYVTVAQTGRKEAFLYAILKENTGKSCIVFTNSCKTAHILTKMLQKLKVSAVLYHGKMQQRERQQAVEQFRKGEYSILVTTNVASRGLDVPHVDAVINYDLPEENSLEEYVHRVGRAGRAARCGIAITLITVNDMIQLAKLEKFLRKKLDLKMVSAEAVESDLEAVERARKAGAESYKEYAKLQAKKKKR